MQATMLCLKSMALGDTLDVQREKRWPNQTGSGTKVVFDPYQEDEFSDTEGVLGSGAPDPYDDNDLEFPE